MTKPTVHLTGGPLDGEDRPVAPPWPRTILTYVVDGAQHTYEVIPGSWEARWIGRLSATDDPG